MKVTLKITNSAGFYSYKEVEVEEENTLPKTHKKAQLDFLNDYINRDGYTCGYIHNVTDAKKRAGIKCTVI